MLIARENGSNLHDICAYFGERPLISKKMLLKVVVKNSQLAIINVVNELKARNLNLTSLEMFEPDLKTVFLHLTGKVRDQSALYGLIAKLRDMGIKLIMVDMQADQSELNGSDSQSIKE